MLHIEAVAQGEGPMENARATSTYTSQVERDGVKYGGVARWDHSTGSYHFISIWDQTHQVYLPLEQLEQEYTRRKGPGVDTNIRSGRAVHSRLKQYILIWHEQQR